MKKSVLIVEDDLDIRDCLRNILELDGYGVEEAANGEEALQVLERFRPDLILLDLNMPVLSGGDFLRRLPDPAIPVLVMTALPGEKPEGSSGFLRKPLDLDTLLEKVRLHSDPPPPLTH